MSVANLPSPDKMQERTEKRVESSFSLSPCTFVAGSTDDKNKNETVVLEFEYDLESNINKAIGTRIQLPLKANQIAEDDQSSQEVRKQDHHKFLNREINKFQHGRQRSEKILKAIDAILEDMLINDL